MFHVDFEALLNGMLKARQTRFLIERQHVCFQDPDWHDTLDRVFCELGISSEEVLVVVQTHGWELEVLIQYFVAEAEV